MMTDALKVRVTRKRVEAEGICSFELAQVDGRPLPAFSAGSHIDVTVDGAGVTRQYSLCNSPTDANDRYLIAVLNDPASRGGSKALHEAVGEGDVVTISPPKNHFPLAHEATKSLLLAGGIGVTPILCMAERLASAGDAFEMHYCTRSRARSAFVERISASPFAEKVAFHFDDGDASQMFDIPARLGTPEAGTHLYVCGPKGFMDAVLSTARTAGWPEAQLHYEFFSADPAAAMPGETFEVEIASTGRVIGIAADQSVTQALHAAGIEVLTSCEQGVCGTCLTRVMDGIPDHRDLYLTPEEQAANDQFLPCCSRAKSSRLLLDL